MTAPFVLKLSKDERSGFPAVCYTLHLPPATITLKKQNLHQKRHLLDFAPRELRALLENDVPSDKEYTHHTDERPHHP